jgi:hypothetical protein
MKFWELVLMRNIWISCMELIMLFIVLLFSNIVADKEVLSSEYLLSWIWLTIAFWYWYKKYERDKEIELIKNFSERYHRESEKTKLWEYTWIINIWYEEYFLYSRWYISELLWKEWDYWIYRDLQSFLWQDYENFSNWKKELFFYSLMPIHQLGLNVKSQKNMVWNEFSNYIFMKIDKTFDMDRWLMEKIYEWDQKKINMILEWQEWIKRITQILTK